MSYFNEDQQAHMRYLDTLKPEEKCYCGWYLLGQCSHCPAGKSCADKLAEREKTETHYVPWFTKDGPKGTQEAACTAYVDPGRHSPEPSCWGCKAWLDNDAEATKRLREAERNRE